VVGTDWTRQLPGSVDLDWPSAARMYDYFLGGAHNFPTGWDGAAVLAAAPARSDLRLVEGVFRVDYRLVPESSVVDQLAGGELIGPGEGGRASSRGQCSRSAVSGPRLRRAASSVTTVLSRVASSAPGALAPFAAFCVWWAYREYQPGWGGGDGRFQCLCGRGWDRFCLVLVAGLSECRGDPSSVLRWAEGAA
jgi:hypothetical protein